MNMTICSKRHTLLKARLLTQAEKLFVQFGVRAVRTEDIAREIGISKKTLYQLVSSKEELIRLFLEDQFAAGMHVVSGSSSPSDPLEQAFQIWDRLIHYKKSINPGLQRDIQRYYPDLWEFSQAMAQRFATDIIGVNLEQGVRQGVYRSDLPIAGTAWWWMRQSHCTFPDEGTAHLAKHQFIRGLLTSTGFRHYECHLDHR